MDAQFPEKTIEEIVRFYQKSLMQKTEPEFCFLFVFSCEFPDIFDFRKNDGIIALDVCCRAHYRKE